MNAHAELDSNKDIKITCFFKEDGMDIEEIIKQSFRFFVKSELMKLCC